MSDNQEADYWHNQFEYEHAALEEVKSQLAAVEKERDELKARVKELEISLDIIKALIEE